MKERDLLQKTSILTKPNKNPQKPLGEQGETTLSASVHSTLLLHEVESVPRLIHLRASMDIAIHLSFQSFQPVIACFCYFLLDVIHQFVMMAVASLITFVQLTEGRSARNIPKQLPAQKKELSARHCKYCLQL